MGLNFGNLFKRTEQSESFANKYKRIISGAVAVATILFSGPALTTPVYAAKPAGNPSVDTTGSSQYVRFFRFESEYGSQVGEVTPGQTSEKIYTYDWINFTQYDSDTNIYLVKNKVPLSYVYKGTGTTNRALDNLNDPGSDYDYYVGGSNRNRMYFAHAGTYTATFSGYYNDKAYGCKVTFEVLPGPRPILATGITISPSATQYKHKGDTINFTARVVPSNTTQTDVTWEVKPVNGITNGTITSGGKFTATKNGVSDVYCYTEGKTYNAHTRVYVGDNCTAIQAVPDSVELKAGGSKVVAIQTTPEEIYNPINVTCSNANLEASYNESTKELTITAKDTATSKNGFDATVTVSAGSVSDTVNVKVIPSLRNLSVTPNPVEVEIGNSQQLKVVRVPTAATDEITFTSADPDIADVDSDGLITGLSAGETTVTVAGGSITKEIPVTVIAGLTGLRFNPSSITINAGETKAAPVTKIPADAVGVISYRSGNTGIATVDSNGNVTGVSTGDTTVTASCNGITAILNVKVKPVLTDLEVTPSSAKIKEGETQQFTVNKIPSDAEGDVGYSIGDSDIATVDTSGAVTGMKPGNTTLTVSCGSISKNIPIEITSSLEEISVSPNPVELDVGSTQQLTAEKVPSDASGDISFKSSKEDVATVTADGLVTAVGEGSAIVTASSGTITKEIIITVYPVLTDLNVTPSQVFTSVGNSEKIIVTKVPINARGDIEFNSADLSVASVDASGVVSGVKEGDTFINVTCGSVTKTVAVNVGKELKDFIVSPNPVNISMGDVTKIEVTKVPADALGTPSFSSDNTGVVAVDSDGNVTPISVGSASITVIIDGITKIIPVSVTPALTGISISPENTTLDVGGTHQIIVTGTPSDAIVNADFISGDTNVATVDKDGLITAVGEGTTGITVSSGSFTKVVDVTVNPVLIDITVTPETMNLVVGESQSIQVEKNPLTAGGSAMYTSSDSGIASVTDDGVVTAQGAGSASITVAVGSISKVITINVTPQLTGAEVSVDKNDLTAGEIGKITVNKEPAGALGTPTFESSDEAVVKVSSDGTITAIGEGTAVITIKIGDVIETIFITVYPVLTDIKVSPTSINVTVGDTQQLNVTKIPADAKGEASFLSNDISIATVTKTGEVLGVNPGTTSIVVTVGEIEELVFVKVTNKVIPSIKTEHTEVMMKPGAVHQINAMTVPETVPSDLEYSTSDDSIATVSDTGLITAVAEGTCTIIVKFNNLTATIAITVDEGRIAATSIETGGNRTVEIGNTTRIRPVVLPPDATDKSVTYESSDTEIAVVGIDGTVTPVAPGVAVITITSVSNPEVSAEVEVTVYSELALKLSADSKFTKDYVSIHAKADGDVAYLVLPNGNQVPSSEFMYNVIDNGSYTFVAVSNSGKRVTESIVINNIDKTPPTLILSSQASADYTEYRVSGLDKESGIDRVILPDGSEESDLPTDYVQFGNGTLTFALTDLAGNVATQTVERMTAESLGGHGETVIGYEGIPTDWTNQDVMLKGFAVNRTVGASVGLNHAPSCNLSTELVEDNLVVSENSVVEMEVIDGEGNELTVPLSISKIDKIKPTASLSYNADSGSIDIEAEDALSGIKQILLPDGKLVADSKVASYFPKFKGTYAFQVEDNAGNISSFEMLVADLAEPPEEIAPPAAETDGEKYSEVDIKGTILPEKSSSSDLIKVVIPTRLTYIIDENRDFISGDYTFTNNGENGVTFKISEVRPIEGTKLQLVAPDTYSDWSKLTQEQTLSSMALLLGTSSLHENDVDLAHLNAGDTIRLPLTAKYGVNWGNTENLIVKYSMTLEVIPD